jgi:hypothetical protein
MTYGLVHILNPILIKLVYLSQFRMNISGYLDESVSLVKYYNIFIFIYMSFDQSSTNSQSAEYISNELTSLFLR